MQTDSVTTPFGRRPMTLGMLKDQHRSKQVDPNQSVDKWKIFRALCEARPLLDISDRALAVLNALLSFYPGNSLSQETGLVIFPSNAQLSIRAHGIAPATLRRHLAALVDAGLLIRKDSPNGKRYARRGSEGEISQAFGFSIAPLITREQEILRLAAQVTAANEQFRIAREQLSLCRRDVSKLIETAQHAGLDTECLKFHDTFRALVSQIPRSPTVHHLQPILANLRQLREILVNTLENHTNAQILDANESQIDRHIKESYPESISESEALEVCEVLSSASAHSFLPEKSHSTDVTLEIGHLTPSQQSGTEARPIHATPSPSISLEMVLRACPMIADYAPGGRIRSWEDLKEASLVVHSMLGVSADAYRHARAIMGHETAAVVIACVLQRSDQIASAGGYLRDLTRKAERKAFSVVPMLAALLKGRAGQGREIIH